METSEKQLLLTRVENALETIRPFLIADGGDIEIVDLTSDYELKVKLLGNCEACEIKHNTLKGGVEATVLSSVPEIKRIVAL